MSREYANFGIADLEKLFENNRQNVEVLKKLRFELSHRKTKRAQSLYTKVDGSIDFVEHAEAGADEFNGDDYQANNGPVNDDEFVSELPEDVVNEIHDWDKEQNIVIELDEDVAALVEAGPGAGKTAVACARVAHLVESSGLEPSKIFLISFTRAAVKELRDRIESFAENPINVAGLKIATLDSFTWQVVRGFTGDDSEALLQSYDGNIRNFLEMLNKGNNDLTEFLEELEHVIIDEGQDLVSIRADLVIGLIKSLPDDCGVTVFSDSAQAIYGFTDDIAGHNPGGSKTVVDRIYDGEAGAFAFKTLDNIHRTKDEHLRELYRLGRERLINKRTSKVKEWLEIKEQVASYAHGHVERLEEQNITKRKDVLVLYRTRSEVLMGSSFLWGKGVAHKVRMSGIPTRLQPWIARVLGKHTDKYLKHNEFNQLWNDRVEGSAYLPASSGDEAWQQLLDNAASGDDRVDISRIREILSRERPPVEFLVDESELPGPVIGTIHASKGREAGQVHLMLPTDRYISNDTEEHVIAEEERVIFVGASRAKRRLMVGQGTNLYAPRLDDSGRTYKLGKKYKTPRAQVEIGRNGDFFNASVASEELVETDVEWLQDWLWEHSVSDVKLYAEYDFKDKRSYLYPVDEEGYLGALSQSISKDIWSICDIVASNRELDSLRPYPTIRNIMMVGSSTAVIPPGPRETLHAPYCESGFVLVPVITAFTNVYFNTPRKS